MSLNLDKSRWTRVKFSEVVYNVNSMVKDAEAAGLDRVIAMEHLDPGELRIQRWGNVEDGTTFTRRVKPGQTLFGKRRAYQRKVAYAEFDAICSGDILTFQANEAQMLPEFLPFLVRSDGFFAHALGTSAGSLSPRTNWTDLSDFDFCLPPLNEQKQLVNLLWAAEKVKQANRDLSSLSRNLVNMFVDTKMQTMFDNPVIDNVPLSKIMQLDCNTEAISANSTYRIAGVLNQGQGLIDRGSIAGNEIAYPRLTKLRAGQVVMRKLTAWEGPIQLVPEEFDGAWVSNEFPAFTINETEAHPTYLEMIFTWPQMWALMKSKVQGSVQRRMRLSPEQLLSVSLPFPQIHIQQEIATAWKELRRLADIADGEADALSAAQNALLSNIFGDSK